MITREKMNQYWRKYASMATAMGESPDPYDRANSELARLAAEMWHTASAEQVEESAWVSNPKISSWDSSVTFDPRKPLDEFKQAWAKYCRSFVISGEVGKALDNAMRQPAATSLESEAFAGMANPPPKKGRRDDQIAQELRPYIHEDAAQAIILEYELEFNLDRLETEGVDDSRSATPATPANPTAPAPTTPLGSSAVATAQAVQPVASSPVASSSPASAKASAKGAAKAEGAAS